MSFIGNWVDKQYLKYINPERTKLENEMFFASAARCVAPATIQEHKSGKYVIVNGYIYKRCIIAGVPPAYKTGGYPPNLSERFMSRLLSLSTDNSQLSIAFKLIPIRTDKSTKIINDATFKNEIKQYDSIKRNKKESNEKATNLIDMGLELERKHNEATFKAIVEDNTPQYHSSLIITMSSTSLEDIAKLESEVNSIFGSEGVEGETPDGRQMETLLAAQPFNKNPKFTEIEMLAHYAAVTCPSTNPNTETDSEGLFFGYDKVTGKPIMIDVDALAAQHLVGLGPTQSGKTFTLLMLLLRAHNTMGRRVIYCTPKADHNTDHRAVIEHLGDIAELIETGPGGRNINPMQILYDRENMGDGDNDPKVVQKYINTYNFHVSTLIMFFNKWFEGTGSVNMSNFLDWCITECYRRFGILKNKPSTWHSANWPVLTDLFEVCEEKKNITKDHEELKTIGAILRKTYSLGKNGVLEYLNNQTDKNIDLSKSFIVVDMSGTPADIEDPIRILIAGMMSLRFSTDAKNKTIFTIDEARVLLQNQRMGKFLMDALTQGASQQVALWLLTQQPADLKDVAEAFQTNTFIKMILGNNLDNISIKPVIDYFGLDSTDVEHIISCKVGEGMLIVGGSKTGGSSKIPMIFKPNQHETNIIKGAYSKNGKKATASELDELDDRLHNLVMDNKFCMSKWAPHSTSVQKWDQKQVANAFGAGRSTAYVSTQDMPENQSLDHFASVMQIAGQLKLNGMKSVTVNHFDDADITFESNGKSWAIEYERDGSHTEDDLINKKFRMQRNYSNIMFVCASSYYPKLSEWLGDDFVTKRGNDLKDFLDSIQ